MTSGRRKLSLVGVSCVGSTTIGRILADRRGWPFFDLGDEIERHSGISVERLRARFFTGYDYRKNSAVVLKRIATANREHPAKSSCPCHAGARDWPGAQVPVAENAPPRGRGQLQANPQVSRPYAPMWTRTR